MRSRGLGAVWAVVVLWALCSGGAMARVVLPAPGQPVGALSGRVVFMSAGHGWTFSNSAGRWFTQRGDSNEIVEDYGNLDQMNLFAAYCFNAGATVVAFRPIGDQTNEVVLDNVSPGVSFQGAWNDSTATSQYFGRVGEVGYRFATIAATETATSTYTPDVPEAGLYPVYAWAAHGANRTLQLYRIRHTGGEATVRVPHHLVGNGWVYLGSYYFQQGSNALSGAVVISNLQPTPSVGSVVVADAIRFGNGMGDVLPVLSGGGTGAVSGYPREEECARYWVQRMMGVGAPTSIYDPASLDDSGDNVGAPPRMAREMNREESGEMADRVFVSFHSNASGVSPPPDNARGCIGLYNSESLFPGTATPNQQRLAYLIASEMNAELSAQTSPPLEVPWFSRPDNQLTFARSDFAFGEINNSAISDEFDATIIEVGFHDHPDDALLLRDPRVRNIMARTACEGVVRYMHEFGGVPLVVAPAPPTNVRAVAVDGGVRLTWSAPGIAEGGLANGYVVYRSTNGFGFGQPVRLSGAGVTSLVLTNLPSDQACYFRVAATNVGGESMPSETVGCRAVPSQPCVLYVNAFDRFDRTLSVRQTVGPGLAGPSGGGGTFDRLKPRRMNSFDYVVPHGEAMNRCGVAFDTCQNEAVASGAVTLTNYAAVIWACGEESTADETFSVVEQVRMTNYLALGGRLFVSGSEIAWDLDRDSGPTSADRNFLRTQLHAALAGNVNDDAGTSFVDATPGSIFSGNPGARFDEGADGVYAVRFPDMLTPVGDGTIAALRYAGGLGGAAAVQHADEVTGSRVVYFGFPFETLATAAMREACLFDVLSYFGVIPAPRLVVSPEMETGYVELGWGALPGRKYQLQFQESLGGGAWQNLGGAFVANGRSAEVRFLMGSNQRFYRVVVVD